MENRNRFLTGVGVELFTGKAERDGAVALLDRAIAPHLATMETGRDEALMRVRMRCRGLGCQLSQRARKKIEELWGEGKELHGLRRFARRQLENVRQEAFMIGWLLNLKRIATLQAAV